MSLTSQQRLAALDALIARLAADSSGGFLIDTLDILMQAGGARAGVAFLGGPPLRRIAERGLRVGASDDTLALRRAVTTMAERAATTNRHHHWPDLKADRDGIDDATHLMAQGFRTVLAYPIVHRRRVLGIYLFLFEAGAGPTDEFMELMRTAARAVAMALSRDRTLATSRQRNRQFNETERMASLGLLTASVAHDLRAPAAALVLQVDELLRIQEQLDLYGGSADTPLGGAVAELADLLDDVQTTTNRLRDMIDQLTKLSQKQPSAAQLDLCTVVEDALKIAKPHLETRGVTLEHHLSGPCLIKGRPDHLTQAVLNLVLNAGEAAEQQTQRLRKVEVHTKDDGQQVYLLVADTGPGIAPTQLRSIFAPYYSTKGPERSGLGLNITSNVVQEHGGHIEVVNLPGGGASFRVVLPRLADARGLRAPLPLNKGPKRATDEQVTPRQIMVVDDDPLFSRTVRRALRPHEVLVCATSAEAQIALLDPEYQPALVVCDMFLPGANGHMLHKRIARSRPDVASRFVFVTGGALAEEEATYLKQSGCPTLFKPLDLDDLLNLLGGAGPESVGTLARPASDPPESRESRRPTVRANVSEQDSGASSPKTSN